MSIDVTKRVLASTFVVCLLLSSLMLAPVAAQNDPRTDRASAAQEAQLSNRKHGPPAQPYRWRNVEIVGGGFVTGVIFNPKRPNLVYARTDIGGAYRLDERTQRWVPLIDWVGWDDWNLLGIESLASDPVDPNRVYLAAGTYTNDWSPINGAILRSTNQGRTWKRTDLPFKLGGNMPGRSMGERLAIDPNKNSILYLGTRGTNGLWKSTDFGATWARVTSFPATGNYIDSYFQEAIGVVWVVFDPRTGKLGQATQTIYVGVADTNASIYRSTDGGATWEAVPGQPTGFLPHHAVLASNGTLYVTYGSTPGPYDIGNGDVWKLDTNTGVWTNIRPTTDTYYGFGGLAVDASNPNIVMVASMNQWWPDDNLYRSTDGGATWTAMWTLDWSQGWPPPRNQRYSLDYSAAPYLDWGGTASPPEVDPKLGWMIGDLEIDPFNPNRVMYVTGATIYGIDDMTRLDSGGNVHISVKAQGLEETAVQDLISPPSGQAHLISALGDIGGFTHNDLTVSPPEGMSKNPLLGGGTSLDEAGLRPEVVVRVGWAGRSGKRGGYSEDTGQTWKPFVSESFTSSGAGEVVVSADGITFVWDPDEDNVGAHYTRDRGATWTPSAGLPANVDLVLAADRVNPNKFYAFDRGTGQLYASTDGGASFVAAASGLPTGQGKLEAIAGREGDLWLATGAGGLWHSTDGGASFAKLASVQEGHTIGFGKAAPGQDYMALYMAGKVNGTHGVYRSDDAGATWVRINDDQHQWGWIGQTITGDPRIYGRVYLGTNGRGIQYGDPVQ